MTETLVIRLRASEEAPASWLIVDGIGARSGPVQSGPVADAHCRSRRAVAPSSSCLPPKQRWPRRNCRCAVAHASRRPCRSRSKNNWLPIWIRCISPSARALPRRPGSGTPVVMIARPVLDRWRAIWEAAGIHPDAAYSESSLIPASPNASRAGAGRRDAARAAPGCCRLCARCATTERRPGSRAR